MAGRFQEDRNCRLLLISLKAGGQGGNPARIGTHHDDEVSKALRK